MSEFDNFVNDLPGSEPGFDINSDLAADSQTDQSVEGTSQNPAPKEDGTEDIPFNKNPKIKRFIERQVERKLAGLQPQPTDSSVIDNSTKTDVPYEWLAMYGDNEDSRKAWKFQHKLLDDYKTQAKQEALAEIRSDQERSAAEVTEFENVIDSSLEDLEEEHGVDLTSNSAAAKKARTEYLDLVQRLSPKDKDGNVTSYADFHEVWDLYQSSKVAPNNSRQKDLAARSITKNNEAPAPKEQYEQGMGFDGVRRKLGID